MQALHFDYTQAAPVATAAFLPPRFLLNGQLAPGTPPAARFLPPGQAFDLTLRLVRFSCTSGCERESSDGR